MDIDKSKLSPMMCQYLDVKSEHQEHILFFRLGDFYEMFFDDALLVSKELELTLTGKTCGLPERVPMCGIPYHASAAYIKRLIDKGYKVAICEQTEDPAEAKGLVRREVIRLVTPGTVIEGDLLEDSKNNYIASFCADKNSFTACFADISTGDVYLTVKECKNPTKTLQTDIINEISKFSPSEIIYNDDFIEFHEVMEFLQIKLQCVCSLFSEEKLSMLSAEEDILAHFKVSQIAELGVESTENTITSLGGLLAYLNKTQRNGAMRITDVNVYTDDEFMSIDITARQNLEITETMRSKQKRGTLLWVLDKTKTAMGKRFIRTALEQPLMNVAEISRRQNSISELLRDSIKLSDLQDNLSGIYDLERLMTRVLYGSASPRDLRALCSTAKCLPETKDLTANFSALMLTKIHDDIDVLDDVCNLIDNAVVLEPPAQLKDGGYIKSGFNETLDELRNLCTNAKDIIHNIEEDEREKTGIKGLKIKYNRVFGYFIEVTNSNLELVPEAYIRKQTLANCERYITQELKELESKILNASEKIIALEGEIFAQVRNFVASKIDVIKRTANAVARLDFLCSLTVVAMENNYTCPQIVLDGRFDVKNSRHPVVEQMLHGAQFVPNDCCMDIKDNQILIITGPNMAGKSTYMRQVAIIAVMAQVGSFVPAQSATVSIVDKIFTRVGASDDLSAGQSTFMVEMSEVAHILKNATQKSLVVLDEIGRGTSTFDGMSIAKAVVEYMVKTKSLRCKTLFATHYHELTSLEDELNGVKNYNIAVKKRGDAITFLRKIVPGGADDSFGIEVAKLAGVPDKVIARAKEILTELESDVPAKETKKRKIVETEQTSFSNYISIVEEKIKQAQIDTLTPLEALNMLYELKKLL